MPGPGGRISTYDKLITEAATVQERRKREISASAVRNQVEDAKRQDRLRREAVARDERVVKDRADRVERDTADKIRHDEMQERDEKR